MAIEDLNLEFEEEEEKKGDGSIDQGVELDFAAVADEPSTAGAPAQASVASLDAARAQKQATTQQPKAAAPAAASAAAGAAAATTGAQPKIDTNTIIAQATKAASQAVQASMMNLSAQLVQQVSQQVIQQLTTLLSSQLDEKLKSIQSQIAQSGGAVAGGDVKRLNDADIRLNDADIKVAVAKNETEFLVDYISEFKVLEYKINQTLLKIHAKSPAFQNEILTVKKMLNDYSMKYKKEKKE